MPTELKLLGNAEAAALLGIGKTNFCHLRRKLGAEFPVPVAELACGPIWHRDDIDAFRRTHYRKALTPRERLAEVAERLSDAEIEIVLDLLA